MNNIKNLVDNKPINFIKSFIKSGVYVLILFFISWFLFYTLSNSQRRQYLDDNWLFTLIILICFLLVTFIQNFISSNIYIYSVIYDENNCQILISWQDYNKLKRVVVSIKDIEVEMRPSGKNTPYLEVKINSEHKKIILNQTCYDGWSKKDMERFLSQISFIKGGIA